MAGQMRLLVTFYLRWLKTAFRHSLGAVDLWSGIAGALLGIVDHFMPERGLATHLAWQLPLWVLGAVAIARFLAAPYWMAMENGALLSTPERDVSVPEALAYACLGEWQHAFSEVMLGGLDAVGACKRFEQLAADSKIYVWGKRSGGPVYERVPAEHWLTQHLDWLSLVNGDAKTEPAVVGASRLETYGSLMTSRSQIELHCPEKAKRPARLTPSALG
jgi:hypothetical protein